MKKLLLGVVTVAMVLSLAAMAFCAEPAEKKFGPNVGDTMKAFKLNDPTTNKDISVSDLTAGGKDAVLVFMQTACSLCVAEITDLVAAAEDFEGKLSVALVSLDFDAKRIQPYKDAYKIPFPILHDKSAATLEAVDFNATPAFVVVDGKGVIKKKVDGYNKAEVKGLIKAYSK